MMKTIRKLCGKKNRTAILVFSHGDTNLRGVCILFRKNLEAEIHSKITDKEGRYNFGYNV